MFTFFLGSSPPLTDRWVSTWISDLWGIRDREQFFYTSYSANAMYVCMLLQVLRFGTLHRWEKNRMPLYIVLMWLRACIYMHLSVIQGEYLRHAAIGTTHMRFMSTVFSKKKPNALRISFLFHHANKLLLSELFTRT